MADILNILIALSSIGLGAVGWLAPRYTMDLLDIAPTHSTMGVSEVRAASGALFVGMGLGALVLNTPLAFAMIGFCWAGAAVGRLTSILADGPVTQRKLVFFGVEAAIAALALGLNF